MFWGHIPPLKLSWRYDIFYNLGEVLRDECVHFCYISYCVVLSLIYFPPILLNNWRTILPNSIKSPIEILIEPASINQSTQEVSPGCKSPSHGDPCSPPPPPPSILRIGSWPSWIDHLLPLGAVF